MLTAWRFSHLRHLSLGLSIHILSAPKKNRHGPKLVHNLQNKKGLILQKCANVFLKKDTGVTTKETFTMQKI